MKPTTVFGVIKIEFNREEIAENFKRGITEMLILKLLSEEDMYGYQIVNLLNERGGGMVTIKEFSLYGPLYKLVEKKCISENRVVVGKRRTRVYYHLEPEGEEYFKVLKEVYSNISAGISQILNPEKDTEGKDDGKE